MNENNRGNTVLLTVIAIATLLVAITGATFAYFTASVQGNAEASSVIVRTAEIGTITYTNGNEIKLDNAYPGAYSEKITFTVASAATATVNVNYTLSWTDVANSFVPTTELVYSLVGESDSTDNQGTLVSLGDADYTGVDDTGATVDWYYAPSANDEIGSGILTPGETHTYTMQVHFLETGADQNSNQGRSFVGKIYVSTGDTGDVYYTDKAQGGTSTMPSAY